MFNGCFQLKKSARRLLRDQKSGSYEGQVGQIKDKSMYSVGSTSGVKVEMIGDSTAVHDFETMISRRDSPEWVFSVRRNGSRSSVCEGLY